MNFSDTELPGVVLFTPNVHRDNRGYFFESWRSKDFSSSLKKEIRFVQGAVSNSVPYTIRGIHYQLMRPVGKLVHCLRGSIYDVAVDLRRSSPTFGKYVGFHLDDQNHQALWIPPGFGHGFLAGSSGASVAYECTDVHIPEYDKSINPLDPDMGIAWPLARGGFVNPVTPVLSNKDRAAPGINSAELFD